jgi:hypothetical protein
MKNIFLALVFLSILPACAGNNSSPVPSDSEMAMKTLQENGNMPRKLIREADIRFETNHMDDALRYIHSLVSVNKAYISEENQNGYENQTGYDLVIRVPEKNLDTLINGILHFDGIEKLENKSIRMQDVTEEFVDVEARMKVKKETEQKYFELLKKAKNLEETLAVERQLSDLRAEIESLEGRMKYLNNRVDMSTLRVSFYEKQKYSSNFVPGFLKALRQGWQVFLYVITGLAYLWVLILVAIAIFFLLRWNRKRKKNALHKNAAS